MNAPYTPSKLQFSHISLLKSRIYNVHVMDIGQESLTGLTVLWQWRNYGRAGGAVAPPAFEELETVTAARSL